MTSVAVSGLLAAALLLPSSAGAFTCDQVIWAVQNFTQAELERMAAPFGGITRADRAKAQRCLGEASAKGTQFKAKVGSARPAS
jgi:hypothetical protein